MKFGRKAGTINSGPSAGGVDWPKALRPGETRVRFVEEIAEWQEYWEHFDDVVKFFPCTSDKATCPGCTSASERTARASKKYLAPVLDPTSGRVYGLKMGQDLANRLSLRNDRNNGTITNRDYTLIRSGQGLDTEYDVEQEEKVAIDLSAYQGVIDLEEMLSAQFAGAWPDFDPDSPSNTNGRVRAGTARSPRTTESTVEDDSPPPRKRAARKAPAKSTTELIKESKPDAPAETDDDPPPWEQSGTDEFAQQPDEAQTGATPPAAEPAAEDDGGALEITEEDLRKMSRTDLIKLARQADLKVTLTMSADDIINKFLAEFSV